MKTADFDKVVGKDKHVVIEFYAQYCGYCRQMNAEWDKLADYYMGNDTKRSDVVIAKMDGSVERSISTRYGIASFPTIVFFKKGDLFPSARYLDMRSFEAFKNWIEKEAGPEEKVEKKEENTIEKRALIGENSGIGSQDMMELKNMINEISIKLDNKVETVSNDINFSQGLSFLLLGLLLGVGISFTVINYQKLGAKRKGLD